MYNCNNYIIKKADNLREKGLFWSKKFPIVCILDSNNEIYSNYNYSNSEFDLLIAAGSEKVISPESNTTLEQIDIVKTDNWFFGYLSYELKNNFESLVSENYDSLNWPDFFFFSPKYILLLKNDKLEIKVSKSLNKKPDEIYKEVLNIRPDKSKFNYLYNIKARLTKEEYLERVNKIKQHIFRGDLYEVNFCQEFYSVCEIDPYLAYNKLNVLSPTPFSCFLKINDKYLISASPERFLKKNNNMVLSQPIKGTIKRGKTPDEDNELKEFLKKNQKEKAENIMIVDLVRNDLAQIAKKKSVNVDELCSVYSFEQVHQMISTVSCQTKTDSLYEIIKATFPMGSMTGAPKINAMKISEKYETTKRGLYSGSVGYINPNNDFDFNVVIRSLQYNKLNNYLSFMVGGAITHLSDPEKEYEECILKAKAITELLKGE